MSSLSERQRKILEFIVSFFHANEFPPTIREIGEQVGISSTSVVNYNLAKLEELQYISRRKEVSRGLSLNWDLLQELKLAPATLSAPDDLPTPALRGGEHSGFGSLLRVPVLGAIAAGQPIQVEARDAASPEDWVALPEGMVKSRGALFALRVKGDSMVDASVLDGDIVILRQQDSANDGDMVAAWIEGDEETTLKYLFREGRNVRLQPANPAYEPIVRPADKVRINGRVVSVLRNLDN